MLGWDVRQRGMRISKPVICQIEYILDFAVKNGFLISKQDFRI